MPGAVMCAPTRYTTRHSSVKPIRDFSSGVLNRLAIAVAGLLWLCAMLLLDAASGRDNLLANGRADLHARHRDRARDLAIGQQLGRPLALANESGRGQRFHRDLGAFRQAV